MRSPTRCVRLAPLLRLAVAALALFVPAVLAARIIIVEVHYHPAGTSEEGARGEFVELFNDEPLSFDLSGYRLEGGIDYLFGAGTIIGPSDVVVVAQNPAALAAASGIEAPLGPFERRLGNGGDEIRLVDAGGATGSRVDYNDRGRWPAAADGAGPSLVLRDPLLDPNESESWGWSPTPGGTPGVVSFETAPSELLLNELHRESGAGWVELYNPSLTAAVDLSGYRVRAEAAGFPGHTFQAGVVLAPRGFVVVTEAELGSALAADDPLLLVLAPDGTRVVDALRLEATALEGSEGRYPDGASRWHHAIPVTPGAPNRISPPPIVISEIHYHPYTGDDTGSDDDVEEFVEITNTGKEVVALEGYAFTAGIEYAFAPGSSIAPGAYLVIAKDPAALSSAYGIEGGLGPYARVLSNSGEMLRLSDPSGNPVDEVRYYDEGTWPRWADGDGPSLELVDLRQDNAVASAWQESDHAEGSAWTQYEYTAVQVAASDSEFHVFLMGAGEVLVDDLEVVPAGGGESYLPNGSFDGDDPLSGWLIEGTHAASRLEPGGGPDGSNALRIVASKRGDTRVNRIETQTAPDLIDGQSYTVRFKARWLRGVDLLMTRSYNHGIARATRLAVPAPGGTPGRANSRALANTGPVLSALEQTPVLPRAGEALTVRVRASDPDGVASVVLLARLDGEGSFESVELVDDGSGVDRLGADGEYAGTIVLPAAPGAVGEFQIEARDPVGLARAFPADAPARSFLFQYDDEIPAHEIPAYRIVLTERDYAALRSRTALSNELLPATLIYRDERIFHDVGVRYRGSAYWRTFPGIGERRSFRVRLSDEAPLRSFVRLVLDDQSPDPTYQVERVVRGLLQSAGGIPYAERRHVQVIVRGRSFGAYEEVEAPDDRFLERAFGPAHDNGNLYKADNHYEIDDAHQYHAKRRNWSYREDKEQLRFHNKKRTHEKEDDFSDLPELLELMDLERTPDDVFDERVAEVIDVEQWIKAIAVLRAAEDWDGLGGELGKNFYLYHHPDGRWRVIPFDHDVALDSLRWFRTLANPLAEAYLYTPYHPEIRRLLERPWLDRRFHAELLRIIEEGFDPQVAHPPLDEAWSLLESSGTLGTCPPNEPGRPCLRGPQDIKNFVAERRAQLLTLVSSALAFIIQTNEGRPFSAFETPVVLRGTAPLEVATVLLEGEVAAVRWVDKHTWELEVPLRSGANDVALVALDAGGDIVGTASTEVTLEDLRFVRGDCDGDGTVGGSVTDAIVLLGFNFLGASEPGCLAACDADGDGALRGTVGDAVYLLSFAFQGGPPPPPPFPECGSATAADLALGCRRPPANCNPDVVLPAPFQNGAVDPWRSSDVGAVEAAGGARLEEGCLVALGAVGGGIRQTADALHYVYQEMRGDFRLRARVADWRATDLNAEAGLMLRDSLEPSARMGAVFLQRRGSGFLHRFANRRSRLTRTTSGEAYGQLDLWLEIERRDKTVSARLSADGESWSEPDTVEIADLPEAVYAGIFTAESGSDGSREYGIATFCDVSLAAEPQE